jgi:conserved oligomeric Golgi complex subunit 6
VSLFLARFTLTDDQVEALTSRDVPVGQSMFDTMDKTDQIRKDCRVLMTGEDGPAKAGYVVTPSQFVLRQHRHPGQVGCYGLNIILA